MRGVAIGVFFSLGLLLVQCRKETVVVSSSPLVIKSWAYQLQNAQIDSIITSGFDLIVMDYSMDGTQATAYTATEIARIKAAGIIPIAYLSIGEAEDYRFYWKTSWYQNPPLWLGRENPDWQGNFAVRYWHEEWQNILLEYIDKILQQGFQGLYLDKVDAFEYWADPENGEDYRLPEAEAAKRMISLIERIIRYTRSKSKEPFYIFIQNGERIMLYDYGRLLGLITGWAAEDLFYNDTIPWPPTTMDTIYEERLSLLEPIVACNKIVLSVDYVDNGKKTQSSNLQRIKAYRKQALQRGYIPYAAVYDRALDELNKIPGIQP